METHITRINITYICTLFMYANVLIIKRRTISKARPFLFYRYRILQGLLRAKISEIVAIVEALRTETRRRFSSRFYGFIVSVFVYIR